MKPDDVISIFVRSYASVMSTKSSFQLLLTHHLAGSATAMEIFDFIGPDGMST